VLNTLQHGKEVLTKIGQTYTLAERTKTAHQCTATLKLTMPTVIDKEDNAVNSAYAAWPDRLMIVGKDGKVAYKGGPGPGGFKVNEVEQWLKANAK